jgi:glycogen debranching enzyme
MPGEYHNGGVWPFVSAFYIAACVAAGRLRLAERRLLALTHMVKPAKQQDLDWGFNEWIKAQTGEPSGQNWQTWSAAMYLYAAACVQDRRTHFFEAVRAVSSA